MAKKPNEEAISMYFSMLAKQSHKKNPRPKEFYRSMVAKRKDRQKKSTDDTCGE